MCCKLRTEYTESVVDGDHNHLFCGHEVTRINEVGASCEPAAVDVHEHGHWVITGPLLLIKNDNIKLLIFNTGFNEGAIKLYSVC